jgi:hypothetical protein
MPSFLYANPGAGQKLACVKWCSTEASLGNAKLGEYRFVFRVFIVEALARRFSTPTEMRAIGVFFPPSEAVLAYARVRGCAHSDPLRRDVDVAAANGAGRFGAKDADIYLGSPATVAASAVAGHITDPRQYWSGLSRTLTLVRTLATLCRLLSGSAVWEWLQ